MKRLAYARKRRGFTLVELLMVAAVIAFFSVMGLKYYSKVNINNNSTAIFNDLNAIVAESREFFVMQGAFTGLTTAVLVDAEIIPPTMVKPDGSVNTMYGKLNAAPRTIDYADDSMELILEKLPKKVCINIATKAMDYYAIVEVPVGTQVTSPIVVSSSCSDGARIALISK